MVEQGPGGGLGGLAQRERRTGRAPLGADRGQLGHPRAGRRLGARVQLLVHQTQQLRAAVRLHLGLERVAPHEGELGLSEGRRGAEGVGQHRLVHPRAVQDRAALAARVRGQGREGAGVQRLGRDVGAAQLSEPVPERRPPRPWGRHPARLRYRAVTRAAVEFAHPGKSGIRH